ncbi:MAG TPA: RidA family protein [Gemmatimonadetes bacterium]|jgi:2-iminobutanoate/2-iminopropanoate deaminase|nr:RidA family protein [Gemmatimonadota bacterium]HIN77286.1 RidA family protein [Gemmatimonadota bacterium]
MQEISTPDAPSPAGHYSQAVVHEGIVYVAGQLPLDPKNAEALPSDPGAQTRRALNNVGVILEAAGSSLSQTLQMTIYVTDIDHWPAVNAAYAEVMGSHRPARAVVPVGSLRPGCILEVQAIAAQEVPTGTTI